MEYATDGDMFQLVVRQRGLLEKDARWYFQQLITAVDYCHRMVRRGRPTARLLGHFTIKESLVWCLVTTCKERPHTVAPVPEVEKGMKT